MEIEHRVGKERKRKGENMKLGRRIERRKEKKREEPNQRRKDKKK